MKPILNVITAGSRIENLYKIEHNLKTRIKDFETRWYVIFDRQRMYCNVPTDLDFYHVEVVDGNTPDCSGAIQKNKALDIIEEGWIYALDDDNKIHPEFNKALREAMFFFPKAEGFVFTQITHQGKRRILAQVPMKQNVVVLWEKNQMKIQNTYPEMGPIDAGQYIVNASMVKKYNARYKPFVYDSDRYFFNSLYNKPGIIYIDRPVVYYNALRYDLHPDYRLTHFHKKLMTECGPQGDDHSMEEYRNYDVIRYKPNYDIISYQSQEPEI